MLVGKSIAKSKSTGKCILPTVAGKTSEYSPASSPHRLMEGRKILNLEAADRYRLGVLSTNKTE